MTSGTDTLNSDVIAERTAKQIDHIDQMLHEIHQIVVALAPLVEHMPRLMGLLDPFAKVRGRRGNGAFPKRAAAPLHVGEASEDRPPMGA